jgi:hypothetical protein
VAAPAAALACLRAPCLRARVWAPFRAAAERDADEVERDLDAEDDRPPLLR